MKTKIEKTIVFTAPLWECDKCHKTAESPSITEIRRFDYNLDESQPMEAVTYSYPAGWESFSFSRSATLYFCPECARLIQQTIETALALALPKQ